MSGRPPRDAGEAPPAPRQEGRRAAGADRSPVLPARTIGALLAFVGVVAAAGATYVFRRGIDPWAVAAAYAAFVFLLVPYLGFGFPDVAAAFRRAASTGIAGRAALLAMIAGPGAMVLLWHRRSSGLVPAAGLILYALAPLVLLRWAERRGPPPGLLDVLAVAAAWLPVEFGALEGLWARPEADPSYLLAKTLSVSVLLAGYVAVRPLEGMGYRWRVRLEDVRAAAAATAAFLVPAIPFALLTGFVRFEPRGVTPTGLALRALSIGLFIALPEEILFRGAILNLLRKGLAGRGGTGAALAISSVIFGLSHLNNFPYMDWRYAVLATYAGAWYGWAYLRTGNLTAGVLTHTAVDMIHRLILTTSAPPS